MSDTTPLTAEQEVTSRKCIKDCYSLSDNSGNTWNKKEVPVKAIKLTEVSMNGKFLKSKFSAFYVTLGMPWKYLAICR